MTSDAKVGLLLGLIFIFIIAFLINGVPNFRDSQDGNNLTRNMTVEEPEPIGIGSRQLDIIRESVDGQRIGLSDSEPFGDFQESRFEMPLPGISDAVKQVEQEQSADSAIKVQGKGEGQDAGVLEVAEAAKPKIYVVQKGDNLTKIAKKFYGSVMGSKKKIVDRLFEANRNRLKSPDKLEVGQKIIIPALESVDGAGIFESGMFEKVKSIGAGYLRGGGSAANKFRLYKVRESDNLWKIAVRELGSGLRYKEIIRLNRRELADEDVLKIGMRLRLPAE